MDNKNKNAFLLLFPLLVLGLLLDSFAVAGELETQAHEPNSYWRNSSALFTTYNLYEFATAEPELLITSSGDTVNIIGINYVGINTLVPADILSPSAGDVRGVTSNNVSLNSTITRPKLRITGSSVNSDTSYVWTIKTIDIVGAANYSTIILNILNDSLAPRYTLNSPANYSMHKPQGTLFNISITELESGLGSTPEVRYDWTDKISTTTVTASSSLIQSDNYYQTTIDIGADASTKYFSYFFNLTDKAGNTNAQNWHYIFVDSVLPTVTLSTPNNDTIISQFTYNYGFSQGDNSFSADIDSNFDPQITCHLYIDGVVKSTVTRSSNSTESLSASLTGLAQGSHSWNAVCTDSAGWETSSASKTFILDTVGPVIALSSPANNSVIANGSGIKFTVIDSPSGVDKVWYSLNGGATNSTLGLTNIGDSYLLNTSGTFQADSNTLVVYSNDTHSNPFQTQFVFTLDVNSPTIQLVSPANNTFGSGTFRINATDDYASTLSCDLLIDGVVNKSSTTANKAFLDFTVALADGSYTWQVNCVDAVGNSGASVSQTVKVDLTKPTISPAYPLTADVFNSLNGTANFNYVITEANPETCILSVDNVEKDRQTAGTNFSKVTFTVAAQNGAFSWKVWCNDSAGNSETSASNSLYYDTVLPNINASSVGNGSITDNSAIISWIVDETSNNTLFYGTNSSDLSVIQKGSSLTTTPSISLAGLSASTIYFYTVQSCDQFNQCTNSSSFNFTTLAASSSSSSSSGGGGGGGGSTSSNVQESCPSGYSKVDGQCVVRVDSMECSPNWKCTEWSSCNNGEKTRFCQDWNLCGMSESKPEEKDSCQVLGSTGSEESGAGTNGEASVGINGLAGSDTSNSAPAGNLITGQAVGFFESMKTDWLLYALIIGITILLAGFVWFRPTMGKKIYQHLNFSKKRRDREEDEIRQKLREQGLIK